MMPEVMAVAYPPPEKVGEPATLSITIIDGWVKALGIHHFWLSAGDDTIFYIFSNHLCRLGAARGGAPTLRQNPVSHVIQILNRGFVRKGRSRPIAQCRPFALKTVDRQDLGILVESR